MSVMCDCVDCVQVMYDEKKLSYDAMMAGLESSKSKLEQEVRVLREDVAIKESRYHYLQMMVTMMKTQVRTPLSLQCCVQLLWIR